MGDLQMQQDSPLQNYGHDVARAKSVPRRLARWLVWSGVATQFALFGIFGVSDVILQSSSMLGLWRHAWALSLAAVAASLTANLFIRPTRSAMDTMGTILSVLATTLGLFWWGYLALLNWAFASDAFFGAD